jgi:hypothetical protein
MRNILRMPLIRVAGALIFILVVSAFSGYGQVGPGTQPDGKRSNNLEPAVPFLLISPDARAGAMGEAGVATSPDANAMHWNPAKLAYLTNPSGISISYSPWLRKLVPDIDLAYLSGYHRLDERNTIGGSLRYFSLGSIQLLDANQNDLGTYSPSEFAIDGTFARKFGENFSLGSSVRYIRSTLSSGHFTLDQNRKAASALAADVSGYFRKQTFLLGKDAELAFGVNISNIGTKVSYADNGEKVFIPTNMKLGGASTFKLDEKNRFTVALDLNKLLIPTNPVRDQDGRILAGKDPDRSVPAGIFGSFSDAPGGFSEELHEISYSLGTEYWYDQDFALRAGYFYEHPTKGNRQYLTMGMGVKYQLFNLDFAYILANQQKSPVANTLRFSLVYNFEGKKVK